MQKYGITCSKSNNGGRILAEERITLVLLPLGVQELVWERFGRFSLPNFLISSFGERIGVVLLPDGV